MSLENQLPTGPYEIKPLEMYNDNGQVTVTDGDEFTKTYKNKGSARRGLAARAQWERIRQLGSLGVAALGGTAATVDGLITIVAQESKPALAVTTVIFLASAGAEVISSVRHGNNERNLRQASRRTVWTTRSSTAETKNPAKERASGAAADHVFNVYYQNRR